MNLRRTYYKKLFRVYVPKFMNILKYQWLIRNICSICYADDLLISLELVIKYYCIDHIRKKKLKQIFVLNAYPIWQLS